MIEMASLCAVTFQNVFKTCAQLKQNCISKGISHYTLIYM